LTTYHKNLTGTDLHAINTWTYADDTTRLAASGFVEADKGKIAWQLSNNTFWVLVDHTIPTWRSLGSVNPLMETVLPDMTNASGTVSAIDIGSPTRKIRNIYTHDLFIDASSLYVNDKKVIEDDSGTITVKTDEDEDLRLLTTGGGDVRLTAGNEINLSGEGGVEITVPADSATKHLNMTNSSVGGNLTFYTTGAGSQAQIYATDEIDLTAPTIDINGDVDISGQLTVPAGGLNKDAVDLTHDDISDGTTYVGTENNFTDALLSTLNSVDTDLSAHLIDNMHAEKRTALTSTDNLDSIDYGWYSWAGDSPTNAPFTYAVMLHTRDNNQSIQLAFGSGGSGQIAVRRADNGTFYPWTSFQPAGTYNTTIGTDTDINTSGATIIDNISVTDGVITSMGTRDLTLANLGYTGETNATADQSASEILTLLKTVDGSGSGLDADNLDGRTWAESSTASRIVSRNSSGDINARLFRSEYDSTNASINYIMTQVDTASNNYIRPSTPAQFRSAVTDGYYNSVIGTDSDINTSGATIIDNIYVTDGVITSMGTRTLTLAALGYTTAASNVVSLQGTRNAVGTWSITGLTVGAPLHFVGYSTSTSTSGPRITYRVTSGAVGGSTGASTTFWGLMHDNNIENITTSSFVVIPTSTTVSISILDVDSGMVLRAYQ
jgi:hypothetical protein